MATILIVDDDRNNLNAMWRVLRMNESHEVERFTSCAEALERAREQQFDLVIADYRMPDMDGSHFLQEFRQLQPDAYRIIASAHNDTELFHSAINRAQIHRFLQKPVDGFRLVQAVDEGLEQVSLSRALRDTQARLTEMQRLAERRGKLLREVAAKYPDALPADWEENSE